MSQPEGILIYNVESDSTDNETSRRRLNDTPQIEVRLCNDAIKELVGCNPEEITQNQNQKYRDQTVYKLINPDYEDHQI